jgi:acid stress-induced BolA-like protein IbaG/YrbA
MDSKSLKVLIEAGAIKKIRIVGEGSHFYMEIITQGSSSIVNTLKGKLKTWATLDAAAKWIHSMGIGSLHVELDKWQPSQRGFKL